MAVLYSIVPKMMVQVRFFRRRLLFQIGAREEAHKQNGESEIDGEAENHVLVRLLANQLGAVAQFQRRHINGQRDADEHLHGL